MTALDTDGRARAVVEAVAPQVDGGRFPVKRSVGELLVEADCFADGQCSPDHPYVREHPQWFRHRPDGSVQYAENPPKKYEDIYPLDFECEDWRELADVILFWAAQGVRTFRVDNPHTKSFRFWEWAIAEVKRTHPEAVFLAEAFTRPKVMHYLAKLGFSQSYTYFAWRNRTSTTTSSCVRSSTRPTART